MLLSLLLIGACSVAETSAAHWFNSWLSLMLKYRHVTAGEQTADLPHTSDMPITGFNVSVEPAALGTASNFSITMAAGSDVTICVDYGDGFPETTTVETDWFADQADIRPFNMVYNDSGRYNVTVWASNGKTYVMLVVQAIVDTMIQGTVMVSNEDTFINEDSVTHFKLEVTSGSFITGRLDPGDGEILTTLFETLEDIPDTIDYLYTNIGSYNAILSLSNSVSSLQYAFNVTVGIPFSDRELHISTPCPLGVTMTFKLRLGNSSKTSCVLSYGDGHYDVTNDVFTGEAVSTDHLYNDTATYAFTVYCKNQFNTLTVDKTVSVALPVKNVHFLSNTGKVHLAAGQSMNVSFTADEGSNVNFTALCTNDFRPCGKVTLADPLSGSLEVPSTDLVDPGYGIFKVTLRGSNELNDDEDDLRVAVDTVITGLIFERRFVYAASDSPLEVVVTCTTGSRVNFTMYFDDQTAMSEMRWKSTRRAVFTHTWTVPGCYTLKVTAVNYISSSEDYGFVCIENPLPSLQDITYNHLNISDIGLVNFTITRHIGTNDPTNVHGSWDFDNDMNMTGEMSLTTASDGVDGTTSHNFRTFGDYFVQCQLHNNVSSLTVHFYVRVGEIITDLQITSDEYVVVVGAAVKFTVHVDTGSDLVYTIDHGDGTTAAFGRTNLAWNNPDDTNTSHAYATSGSAFDVTIMASNIFGTIGPITLSHTILVQHPVLTLSLITPSFQQVGNITFDLELASEVLITPSIPIVCDWTHNGISIQESGDALSSPGAVLRHYSEIPDPGPITASVNCSNAASWGTATVTFNTEIKITGLRVALNKTAKTGSLISFGLYIDTGSHVVYTINMGDGTAPTEVAAVNMLNSSGLTTTAYKYSNSNSYTVSITASNDISSKTEPPCTIVIQDEVIFEHLIITLVDATRRVRDKTLVSSTNNGTLLLTIDIVKGQRPPTDAFLDIRFKSDEDSIGYFLGTFPYQLGSPLYSDLGNYTVAFNISNMVSTISHNTFVQVQEKLSAPVVTADIVTPFPQSLRIFKVAVPTGSDFTLTVDFADGNTKTVYVNSLPPLRSFDFSGYQYVLPGRFAVTVTVANAFDTLTTELTLLIVGDIPEPIQLTTNSPVEFTPGQDSSSSTIKFKLSIAVEDRLDVGCQLLVNYGDGIGLQAPWNTTINNDITWSHAFVKAGFFTVKIKLTTLFDSEYFEVNVSVQVRMSDMSILLRLGDDERIREENEYPVGSALKLTAQQDAEQDQGTGAIYDWTIRQIDGPYTLKTQSTSPHLLYAVSSPGEYQIKVISDNGIANGEPSFPKESSRKIAVKSVGIIDSFKYRATIDATKPTRFALHLSKDYTSDRNIVAAICVKFMLGEEVFWISAELRHCSNVDKTLDYRNHVVQQPADTYVKTHRFTQAGTKQIHISVILADGREFSLTGNVKVKEYCYAPVVKTRDQYEHLVYRRHMAITIPSQTFSIAFDCSNGGAHHKYRMYSSGGVNVSHLLQINSGDATISPYTLDHDTYTVTLTVTMDDFPNLSGSGSVTLKIVPSDIEISFASGSYIMVALGREHTIEVSAATPDYPDAPVQGLLFSWYCYEEDMDNSWIVTGVAPRAMIPTGAPDRISGLDICRSSESGEMSKITIDTAHLTLDQVYVIEVHAKRGEEEIGAVRTKVEVVNDTVHSVSISCLTNCLSKVTSQRGLDLVSHCPHCPGDSKYIWTVQESGGTRRKRSPSSSSEYVSISPDDLSEGSIQVIQLEVESETGRGKMLYLAPIDYSPRGGYCGSDPGDGNTSTVFNFYCKNWEDDGWNKIDDAGFHQQEAALLSYSFAYVDQTGLEHVFTSGSTRLPSGDPADDYMVKVKAFVADSYGTRAETFILVKVKPYDDPTLLADVTYQLTNKDLTLFRLNLDSTLDSMGFVTMAINNALAKMADSKTDADGSAPSGGFTPTGTVEEELFKQEEKQMLELLDKVVGQFPAMLSDADDLSPAKTLSIARMMRSTPLPPTALPSTTDSMVTAAAALVETMANRKSTNRDEQEQMAELGSAASSVMNELVKAAGDKLTLPEVNADDFRSAIADETMTEAEEAIFEKMMLTEQAELKELRTNTINTMLGMVGVLAQSLAADGRPTATLQTDTMTILVQGMDPDVDMSQQPVSVVDASGVKSAVTFDTTGTAVGLGISAQVAVIDKSVFGLDGAGDGPVLQASLTDAAGKTIEFDNLAFNQELLDATIVQRNWSSTEGFIMDDTTGMTYHTVTIDSTETLLLDMTPEEPTSDVTIGVYINYSPVDVMSSRPNITHYDMKVDLPRPGYPQPWQIRVTDVHGLIYIGVSAERASTRKRRQTSEGTSVPVYSMQSGLVSCRGYDKVDGKWTYEGCTVNENSTMGTPSCVCVSRSDIQDYSSSFTVPTVNPIDFKRIFDNFEELLGDNASVFATVSVILVFYVILVIWARRSDLKDVQKWGVLPLSDNQPTSSNFYKLSVYTGMRRGAGTKSNIMFVLTGDNTDTDVRQLKDKNNRAFSTSSIRQFILATEQPLGALTYVRIWHDNTGKGDAAGWFLDKIVVEDMQTKCRYFFLAGQWLAVDEDEGLIDRIIPVAGRDEITGFNHLFFDKTRRKLFDDHLWVSLVGRPSRSNFSRLQRLTCILCLLSTTMVANAMWYGSATVTNDRTLKLGPITLSAATLLVSIFGSLTVIPINTLIMMLFRKHRPKEWPSEDEVVDVDGQTIQVESKSPKRKWWKRKYPLPYWCAYVAWTLAIMSSLVSMFIVIFYSLEWGKEKSEEWLSSLVLSVVQSVVLVQPLKVIMLAMIMALVFKTLDDDDDAGERRNNGRSGVSEELTDDHLTELRKLTKFRPPDALSEAELEEARTRRRYEKQMWTLIKEASSYFLFLLLICFIVWGSKSSMLYYTNNFIMDEMAGGSVDTLKAKVTHGQAFWEWSRQELVRDLFFMFKYNGDPGTPRDRQYLADGANIRVGPLVMRQVRVKPNSCDALKSFVSSAHACNDLYYLLDAEDRNFTTGWRLDERGNKTDGELSRAEKAFKFRGFRELRTMPYWGKMATYGGGGYVANLGTTKGKALSLLNDLLEEQWVDRSTRAIFIEFTVYNPNINMFAYVNYLLELPATGAIHSYPKIMAFQLYTRLSGMTLLVVACEVLYMMLIVFFMVREGLRFKRLGKEYWKEPWNYVELGIICMSWGALGMYLLKEVLGRVVMADLMNNKEEYTNFALFAYYDEIYWYVIGTIVFMCNIKFLKILRFNKHVSQFAGTLRHASGSLLSFGVMFTILFMAFTSSGFLLFSRHMLDFHNVISVMESLYSMLIGKFDFREMEKADRSLGPIYFVVFMILMFFVIVNMFLGIIGTAYAEVRAIPSLAGNEYLVMDFIAEKARKIVGRTRPEAVAPVHYLDPMDALSAHLDTLDRMVTDECRQILGLDQLNHDNEPGCSGSGKTDFDRKSKDNMQKLTILTKLQDRQMSSD